MWGNEECQGCAISIPLYKTVISYPDWSAMQNFQLGVRDSEVFWVISGAVSRMVRFFIG